ncbi:peptide-methionine (R)-S-oxide reductase MsrB [Flaviaesturariibacter amylovorans]|uniref:Peptide methionine sulfoxide reductase MsrB n=1 Tax=Flaviaesturariibacter amylovorans TaxID=1084520 RepID=A0ABP8HPN9_9BACT
MKRILVLLLLSTFMQQCSYSQKRNKEAMSTEKKAPVYSNTDTSKVQLPDADWRKYLSPDAYAVAREKGTERPWSSPLEGNKEKGNYYCAACGNALFVSDTKFDSGCGWPSFYQPVSKGSIIYTPDRSHGMERTEVQCGRCKAHLGHVFDDGPPPTGLRYCINGVVLDFKKAEAAAKAFDEKKGQ